MFTLKFKKLFAVTLILTLVVLTGCTAGQEENQKDQQAESYTGKISIAEQFGLGYAPLQIMKEKKLIEKYLPGIQVEWKQMGTGGVIREALVSGDLDIGFMGIPPYLVAWEQGVDWKIATGLSNSPQGLQTFRQDIKTLADIKAGDKIAVPIPGSVQHILLAMQAERDLGDPKALDNNLVAMTHPDGAAALISEKDISAHFTSPPYMFEELKAKNIKQLVDAEKAFGGEHSFLVGVTTKDFHDNSPQAYAAFLAAVNEAVAFINNNPEETAKILAPQFELNEETTLEYLTWPGTNYTTTVYGLMGFAEFMKEAGFLSKAPADVREVTWENVQAAIGKKAAGKSPLEEAQFRK